MRRRSRQLKVAGAFHTPLMEPASRRLRKALSSTRFLLPEVPVVANVDARAHRGAGEWRTLLARQLCNPVRWRQSMQTLGVARDDLRGRGGTGRGPGFVGQTWPSGCDDPGGLRPRTTSTARPGAGRLGPRPAGHLVAPGRAPVQLRARRCGTGGGSLRPRSGARGAAPRQAGDARSASRGEFAGVGA